MTNIKFLLIGTSLSLIPNLTFAQCVATQDCETLGYTETSCNGSKGVKCPFGNKWACLTSEEEILNLACDKLGFTYTCTGTGEKGAGNDCNGKYTSCTCASGYEWKNNICQPLNGAYEEYYYCNGRLVGVRATGMDFYIAMQDLGKLTWPNAYNQCLNYVFCGNLKGELPSTEQLQKLYYNKSRINTLLSTHGGATLRDTRYWSSAMRATGDGGYLYFYYVNLSNGDDGYRYDKGTSTEYTRPVLTSW